MNGKSVTTTRLDGSGRRPWRGPAGGVRLVVVVLGVSMSLAACSSAATPQPPSVASSPAGGVSVSAPSTGVPDTPAGKQLSWLLDATKDLPIDAQVMKEHLSADFIDHVSPNQLNQTLSPLTPQGGLQLKSIASSEAAALVGIVDSSQGPLEISLSTQADGKIQGLFLKPIADATVTATS